MKFTKMHGAGNDYVYVDVTRTPFPGDPAAVAQAISNRHTGVGSDGLILIARSERADLRMIMYNADGSEGEMCGNGLRCLAKYAHDHKLVPRRKRKLQIETRGGTVEAELHVKRGDVHEVTIAMGAPRPIPREFHVRADGVRTMLPVTVQADDLRFNGTVVSLGNPHFVVEVEGIDDFPVDRYGPLIEKHADFPSRTNIEFVEAMTPDHVWQRTWERGSGETFACGSGACATAAALRSSGRIRDEVTIDLLGGALKINQAPGGELFLTGPAVEVFTGVWLGQPAARSPRRTASRESEAR